MNTISPQAAYMQQIAQMSNQRDMQSKNIAELTDQKKDQQVQAVLNTAAEQMQKRIEVGSRLIDTWA